MALKDFTLRNVHLKKDTFLNKIGFNYLFDFLNKLKVKPTHLTLLGGIFSLIAVYFVVIDLKYYIVFVLLHIFLDTLDGSYARYIKFENEIGEKVDHIIDAIFEILLELRVAFYINQPWMYFVPLLFIGDLILINLSKQKKERYPARYGMFFFMFGLYIEGMIIQIIMPLITIPLKFFVDLTKKKTKI